MGRLAAIVIAAVLLLGAGALSLAGFGVPTVAAVQATSVRVGSVATAGGRGGGGVIFVGGGGGSRYSGGGGFRGYGK